MTATTGSLSSEARTLLQRAEPAVLTTIASSGQPRSWVMWAIPDGDDVVMSTRADRPQVADVLAEPRAALLVYDREQPMRYVELRGAIRVERERAAELTAALQRAYLGPDAGEQRSGDRVILRLVATHSRFVAWG